MRVFVLFICLFHAVALHSQKVIRVKYESQADLNIFVVRYESQCDLKVYFVDYASQAGWRQPEKQYLLKL